MHTYLVVGASRGIGLALVKELLKDEDSHVLATVRNIDHARELRELKAKHPSRLFTLEFDVTEFDAVKDAALRAAQLLPDGCGLDCLISNAAINLQEVTPFEDVDPLVFQKELVTNVVAPLHVVQCFLPLLRISARTPGSDTKVVFVSSSLGSIQAAPLSAGLCETYSVTKAGLGMLARKWGASLKKEGICTVLLDPGYTDTDMGNSIKAWIQEHAQHMTMASASACAEDCLKVIRDARIEDAVLFSAYDGSVLEW